MDFETDTGGFAYQDDTFGTSEPGASSGDHDNGYVEVKAGKENSGDTSGGWVKSFTLGESADASVTLDYRLELNGGVNGGRLGEALLALDGTIVSYNGNPYLAQQTSEGNTGWQTVTVPLGTLFAGAHTITVGVRHVNANKRNTKARYDDITLETTASGGGNTAPTASDVSINATEDGAAVTGSFDGDDADADDDPTTLIYAITSQPSEGSASNNNDGTFDFDPGTDFQDLNNGETRDVTFTYTATDSHAAVSNTATITVTVSGVDEGGGSPEVHSATFDTDSEGFAYADDAFLSTSQPAYADGAWDAAAGFSGGGLRVTLGGIDDIEVLDMSGGWSKNFTATTDSTASLTLRYRLDASDPATFEPDEYAEALVGVDGTIVNYAGNPYLERIYDGGFGVWQQVTLDLGQWSAGAHTITLGGYVNKKTFNDEDADIYFDDFVLTITPGSGGGGGTGGWTPGNYPASDPVGALSGEFGVTPDGATSYAVPISVPTGTTGVQPGLTLQYNSRGGNGPVGMGWSIGGLSFITRCATDLYHDAVIDAVDFDALDRFCLNGQRLVPISGTYGADGTEYRTAFEEFSRIISYGSVAGGPEKFKVWRKSGEILEFGYTEPSRLTAGDVTGNPVRIWALNRLSDTVGNYIDFTYYDDDTLGETFLTRVDYTGNAATGLTPYNSVQITYEDRPDIFLGYQAGTRSELHKRITNVEVFAGASLYRDYQIAYGTGASNRSRISSLTECAGDGTCFPPTTFDFSSDGTAGFNNVSLGASSGITGGFYNNYVVAGSGDFNGDGMTDLHLMEAHPDGHTSSGNSNDVVWLADGDGTFTEVTNIGGITGSGYAYYSVQGSGDFNGDGLTDLYLMQVQGDGTATSNGNSNDYVWLSDGDGTFTEVSLTWASGISGSWYNGYTISGTGDFNGDGLTDFHLMEAFPDGHSSSGNSADVVWLSNGDGTFTTVNNIGGVTGSGYAYYSVQGSGDFNGDGLTDLYLMQVQGDGTPTSNGNSTDYVWLSDGDGTFSEVSLGGGSGITGGSYNDYGVKVSGDFNGDGLTDLYLMRVWGGGLSDGHNVDFVWLSKGDGTFKEVSLGASSGITGGGYTNYGVASSGDFNGDGLSDIYLMEMHPTPQSTGNANDHIWLSRGDGTFADVALGSGSGITGGAYYNYGVEASGDFNGDGLIDLYLLEQFSDGRSAGNVSDYVWLSDWQKPDLISKMTNGLDLATEVDYKRLTDATIYTKGSTAAYPEVDVAFPMNVVAEVRADDGIGGQNSQTYAYEGLRVHVKGLGNLGFRKMVLTDVATGIVTESTYSQDWANHHQGLLEMGRTIAPGGTVLEEKTVDWDVRFFPTVDGSLLCFRFTPQTVTTKHDLNGVQTVTVTEDSVFDDFGNPTQVTSTTIAGADTFTKITDNTYTNDTVNWILSRLTQATVTHQATGQTDIVRTSSFTYDAATGLMTTETIEPGDPLFHTKTYAHNGNGAVTSITETWGSTGDDGIVPTSRVTGFTYDTEVRYRVTETNPFGHTQTTVHHSLHGLPTSTTGPNSLTTAWEYDSFGRVDKEIRADGTETRNFRYLCDGDPVCPTHGAIKTITETSGAPPATAYHDKLLREIRATAVALDGRLLHVDTEYDALGRVARSSVPFYDGDTPLWTTVVYDVLGRPTLATKPDNSTQTTVYNGLEQTSTNELNQTKTVRNDGLGRLVEAVD
ncbi:MAG: hypothetical protein GY788_05775, partial [bacterium]|nr:hypothetical protein [bacterium]